MTICVAVRGEHETWIGSDGISTAGSVIVSTSEPKWTTCGDWAAANSGDTLSTDLMLMHRDEIFDRADDGSRSLRFRAWVISRKFREICLASGWEPNKEPGEPDSIHSHLILAHPGGLFDVSDSGSVCAPLDGGIVLTGSGFEIALGAFHATLSSGVTDPEKLVRASVEAAIARLTNCGGEAWYSPLPALCEEKWEQSHLQPPASLLAPSAMKLRTP